MAVEEFGRFWGLSDRSEELVAEQRWGDIRRTLAGDYRQTNQRWHQDPVSLRNKSEVRTIYEGYPAHTTVVNAYAMDEAGNFLYPELPDVKEAEQRFARQDWPLGTKLVDTLDQMGTTYVSED